METHINIKGTKLALHLQPQLSPKGRPIRLTSIQKNCKVPEKWIDGGFKNHYIYTFIYLDDVGGLISFEFDYYGNYISNVKV
jgi:hypothetical protein